MNQEKKVLQKNKKALTNKKKGKYHEKIKVDASFEELLLMATKSSKKK